MEKRNCLECKDPVKGRIDKKFCSDYCRNAYNNSVIKTVKTSSEILIIGCEKIIKFYQN